MFEVDVKNVTEERRRGGGPAQVWGFDSVPGEMSEKSHDTKLWWVWGVQGWLPNAHVYIPPKDRNRWFVVQTFGHYRPHRHLMRHRQQTPDTQ